MDKYFMTHTMNYVIMDLSEIGLLNYKSGTRIHNQTPFPTTYTCIDTRVRISFMYVSQSIHSNTLGVDEVRIYIKEENCFILPVTELTIENIVDCLASKGYANAKMKFRKTRIDNILAELEN